MSTNHPKQNERRGPKRRRPSLAQRLRPWLIAGGVGVLVLAIWFTGRKPEGGVVAKPSAAPEWTLPGTDGSSVSLSALRGQNVLLYFNEGVGCDACFYQMTSLEKDASVLKDAGISKVIPIVVNPLPDVQQAVTQFGLKTPWLVDADKSVSDAYHMIGTGMHADLPGHGFVLIDATGQVKWTMNYPSMYASAKQIVNDMGTALG